MRDLVRNLGLTLGEMGASEPFEQRRGGIRRPQMEGSPAGVLSAGGRHRAGRQGCQEAAAAPQARAPWDPGTWIFFEGLATGLCSGMECAVRQNGIEGK